jgi:uncharacterized protein YjgD (DUF1641 family)
MEWTGFNEWIKTKKGEVPKAEVEEFFQQNQIQVQEVVKSNKTEMEAFRQLARDKTADELELLMSNDYDLYNNRNEIYPLIEKYRSNELEVTEWDELNELFDKFGYDEGGYISNYYQGVYGSLSSSDIPGTTRFQAWQLPGGENYRELLLIVPPKKVPYTKENVVPLSTKEIWRSKPKWTFDRLLMIGGFSILQMVKGSLKKQNKAIDYLGDDDAPMPPKQEITQEEALEQVLERQPDPAPRYTGGHFEENDVVAHIRFNERVDPDGNKVLFIEEIQSDWAHKGQSEGFKGNVTKLPKEIKIVKDKSKDEHLESYKESLIYYENLVKDLKDQRNRGVVVQNREMYEAEEMLKASKRKLAEEPKKHKLIMPDAPNILFISETGDLNKDALNAYNKTRPICHRHTPVDKPGTEAHDPVGI